MLCHCLEQPPGESGPVISQHGLEYPDTVPHGAKIGFSCTPAHLEAGYLGDAQTGVQCVHRHLGLDLETRCR